MLRQRGRERKYGEEGLKFEIGTSSSIDFARRESGRRSDRIENKKALTQL